MSEDQELDLKPHAVIVANDLARFGVFAAFLEKNGFPCQNVQSLNEVKARPGSVYFLSFNLHSESAILAAKKIEQTPGMVCIVFAEEAGVQTAAKLSSAKMSQTLQYPYTEKNFLMALQTIVKNRKAQFEKDLRKRQHEERLKARQQNSAAAKDHGVIFQEAPEAITDSTVRVFKTDAAEMFSEIQSGAHAKSFFIIQDGPATAEPSERSPVEKPEKKLRIAAAENAPAFEPARRSDGEAGFQTGSGKNEFQLESANRSNIKSVSNPENLTHHERPALFRHEVAPALTSEDKAAPEAPDGVHRAPQAAREYQRPMSHFWAVLGVCLFGSAVCLYCVYQILTL